MADNQPLFGGGPAVSPSALDMRRKLAAALQMQGQDASPIRSPWQGVGRIAQAMMGGYEGYKADQAEQAARQNYGDQFNKYLSSALAGGQPDIGSLSKMLSNPFAPQEGNAIIGQTLQPKQIDDGLNIHLLNPLTNREIGVIPKTYIGKETAGDTSRPAFYRPGPGGEIQQQPIQTPGQPVQTQGQPPVQPPAGNYVGNNGQVGPLTIDKIMPQNAPAGPGPGLQGLADFSNQQAALRERMKTTASEGAKAAMVPVAEIMKETKTAPQALNALNIIEDTMRQYGDKITTGPAAEGVLKLKQAVNGLTGTNVLGDTAPAEIIKKLNAQLASASLPAFTNRGTQFDLKVFMENNPGLAQSPQGTLFLTNILKQIHRQNLQLAQVAQDPSSWQNWPAIQQKFYQEHPILNPLTQRPLGMQTDTPQQQGFSRDQLEAEARRRGLMK